MPHAPKGKKQNSTKGGPADLAPHRLVGPLGLGDGAHVEDHSLLVRAEVRVPAIEDQQRAIFTALVPRLMLDRVVEREGLTYTPLADLAADPKAAAVGHDQRQMDDRPDIGDAGVGRDSLAGLQD